MDFSVMKKLELKNPPVAVKFYVSKPEGYEKLDQQMGLCQMVPYAQKAEKPFYITQDNENCFGKVALGMKQADPVTHSGQVGYLYNVFDDPRVNARLYQEVPLHPYKTVNYVVFACVEQNTFGGCGFARIDVRHDSDISGHFKVCSHNKSYPFLKFAYFLRK